MGKGPLVWRKPGTENKPIKSFEEFLLGKKAREDRLIMFRFRSYEEFLSEGEEVAKKREEDELRRRVLNEALFELEVKKWGNWIVQI